jgi:sulfite exporter TauE/SafE
VSLGLLASALVFGLAGGLHCLTMCGGFLTAIMARDAARSPSASAAPAPLHSAATLARRQWVYQAGRLTTYALLGAMFGAAGATVLGSVSLLPLQKALYVVANVFLLLLAASLVVHAPALALLQRAGARVFGVALPRLRPLLRGSGLASQWALGLVWGLVPCALIYSVLPLALFAGGVWQGAMVMLAFGVGTLPNLLFAGYVLQRVKRRMGGRTWRLAAASMLVALGVAGIYRALWVPGSLAMGPFCLTL